MFARMMIRSNETLSRAAPASIPSSTAVAVMQNASNPLSYEMVPQWTSRMPSFGTSTPQSSSNTSWQPGEWPAGQRISNRRVSWIWLPPDGTEGNPTPSIPTASAHPPGLRWDSEGNSPVTLTP